MALLSDPGAYGLDEASSSEGDNGGGDGGDGSLDEMSLLLSQLQRDYPFEPLLLPVRGAYEPLIGQPLVAHVLETVEALLMGKFPDDPLRHVCEALMAGVLPVSVHSAKVFNAPERWRNRFLVGQVPQWRPDRHGRMMNMNDQLRSWPVLMDALTEAATVDEARRPHAFRKAAELVRSYIQQGFPIDATPEGLAIVHVVAGHGAVLMPLLNQLFWSGANLGVRNSADGSLAIEVAAMMGHVAVVKQLHSMGCLPGRAIFCAIRESQIEVINALLRECGVNGNQRWGGSPSFTPLEFAVMRGNVPIAKVLMDVLPASSFGRELSPDIRRIYGLPAGSTVAHLGAKLGGNRGELLGRLSSATTRKALLKVCDPRVVANISTEPLKCWDVMYRTLLNPSWSGDRDELNGSLEEAIALNGDPAAHNAIGWTSLMVCALMSEPDATRAMLSRHSLGERQARAQTQRNLLESAKSSADIAQRQAQEAAERVLYSTSASGA